jgi:predicted small integral membrane protein
MNWMAWTAPTAVFFAAIGTALIALTALELIKPTVRAKGCLPMATTRGDRFFISLLSAAFIHLVWLGLLDAGLVIASLLALIWAGLLMRWG